MKKIGILLAIVFATTSAFAQRGKDGNKTVTAAATQVNEYTTLAADATAGQSSITVASNTFTGVGTFTTPLAKGDLVMIIQMQGATIDYAPDDNTYGAITNYNNCGNNELAEVLSVTGSQQITFICPLKNSYTASGRTQVIRVPRYNSLTINANGGIACPAWDGTKGGVLAVEVLGSTVVDGKISASSTGFRGGLANENQSTNGVTGSRSTLATYGGEKGEGIAGYVTDYDNMNGRYSFGAPANGGGGGNGHNSGGGGGGNAGPIAWTGFGNPDLSTPNWAQAWDLEGNSFSTSTSSGGGKGGYTFSANNKDALTEPLYTSAWGGDWRNNVGGRGGRPLDYSTGRLFMGGGGGAADQNDNTGGDGGVGGGIIYLVTFGPISGTGTVDANGNEGETSGGGFTQGQDGGGGGGAGGTVIINTTSTLTGIVTIAAKGGKGGDQNKLFGNDAYGPGGGGGGGYIATSACAIPKEVDGGINGTTSVVTMSEFPPNGATKGGSGLASTVLTNYDLTATGGTACTGQQLTLDATVTGTGPQGYSIEWIDETGASVGTGASIQYTFTQPQTLYAHTCPGWFTVAVQLTAGVNPTALFTYTDQGGFNAQFQNTSTNGTSYSWNFGDNATSTDPNPLHHYNSEGTYTVTLITINDCGSDTVTQSVTVIKVGLNSASAEAVTLIGSGETGVYYIEPGTANCKQLDVLITDMAGRTLQQNRLFNAGNNRVGPINLGNYTQGMYILSFTCEGKMYYAKMVVR